MTNSYGTFLPLKLSIRGNGRFLSYKNRALELMGGFCPVETEHLG